MKKAIFFLNFVIITLFTKAQVVNIPDNNFRNVLFSLPTRIDTNYDGQIQVSEAIAYTGTIDCSAKNIIDLTGIEAFINIVDLNCSQNQLQKLDLSRNIGLIDLSCGLNNIDNLDISKNTNLMYLSCGQNSFSSLDLSKNTALKFLQISNSLQLTELDLSKNAALEWIDCAYNIKLLELDVSNNKVLKYLSCIYSNIIELNLKNGNNSSLISVYADINPNLNCIEVDNVANANSYTSSGKWRKDAKATYNINCALAVNDINKKEIAIFPNPVKDILNFSEEISNIKITDFSGKVVKQISNSEKSIDIAELANGTYIISATTKTGETVNKKFIKE